MIEKKVNYIDFALIENEARFKNKAIYKKDSQGLVGLEYNSVLYTR